MAKQRVGGQAGQGVGADRDQKLLRRKKWPASPDEPVLRIVDLFSGAGGMTLGAFLAARDKDRGLEIALAVEKDPEVAKIYEVNFQKYLTEGEKKRRAGPEAGALLEKILTGELGQGGGHLEKEEVKLKKHCGRVGILMGGPPCQGNSDLNNRTKGKTAGAPGARVGDQRNVLYERMGRAAEVLEPRVVIIENVPTVVHASGKHVDGVEAVLKNNNYGVHRAVVHFDQLGVPQSRRRHLLIAAQGVEDEDIADKFRSFAGCAGEKPKDVEWAIGDLAKGSQEEGSGGFDAPPRPSPKNRSRLDWYQKNKGKFELPLHGPQGEELRPNCHQKSDQKWGRSYKSIYGRMQRDRPAQTVTTGFGSMGQGCYVHYSERRTITPHEAARLQTFPDFFDFTSTTKRTKWAMAIGNAVPPLGMREIVSGLWGLIEPR